jgi:tetratricopeptide (TPR) repeat protein
LKYDQHRSWLETNPESHEDWLAFARFLLDAQQSEEMYDPEEARRAAQRAMQLSKGHDPLSLHQLAEACFMLGDSRNAIAYCERAIEAAQQVGNSQLAESLRASVQRFKAKPGNPER